MTGHEVTDRLISSLAQRITRGLSEEMGEEVIAQVIAQGIRRECDSPNGAITRRCPAQFLDLVVE